MIEKELTSIKFACFRKIKRTSKDKMFKNLEALQKEQLYIVDEEGIINCEDKVNEINNRIAAILMDIEKDRLDRDVKYLENLHKNKGKAAAVFGLRDKVLGKRKVAQEQIVLKDPSTGAVVNTPEEIKRVSLSYLVNLLTKNAGNSTLKYT